ncbi:MAG: hypothetical protein ACFFFC_03980 [Candidatus Thorarchaeota archaeon]
MEYKDLVNVSNIIIAAVARSLMRMGLSGDLLISQVSSQFAEVDLRELVEYAGLGFGGDGAKSTVESFVDAMNKLGAVQNVTITGMSDSEIGIELADCALIPATNLIRGDDPALIPPCAWMAMLTAAITESGGKIANVSEALWQPEKNTCAFKITLE